MSTGRKYSSVNGFQNEGYTDEDLSSGQEMHGQRSRDIANTNPTSFYCDDSVSDEPIHSKTDQELAFNSSNVPNILIELHRLYFNRRTKTECWINKSRWIVYQEDYNMERKRFDRPHLPTISAKGIKFFQTLFKEGWVSFEDGSKNYLEALKTFSDAVEVSGKYSAEELWDIRNKLTLNHYLSGANLDTLYLDKPILRYDKDNKCFEINEKNILPISYKRNVSSVVLNENVQRIQSQKKLSNCLPTGTEGFVVSVGASQSVDQCYLMLLHFEQPFFDPGLMDTLCPIRFMMFICGPKHQEEDLLEVGRVFSTMMSNKDFREIAYHADSKDKILSATKAFVESSVLIHVKKRFTMETLANCRTQLHYYAHRKAKEKRRKHLVIIDENKEKGELQQKKVSSKGDKYKDLEQSKEPQREKTSKCSTLMKQFWPPFHQFFIELKGLRTQYLSDFRDGFTKENAPVLFSGLIFVYFVVLSPALTFGALLNSQVSPKMTITMLLISSGAFQFIHSLLCGQPLEIVGVTATIFIIEQVLSQMAILLSINIDVVRFWIGIYMSGIGLIFIAFNGTIIIKHFRRSVEEVYNTYYSVIIVLSACFTMFKALPQKYSNATDPFVNRTTLATERNNFGKGGTTLFLALIMLNLCLYLVQLNRGVYLRRMARKLFGAFNIPLGIILVVALNYIFFSAYDMPMLNIPPSGSINLSLWISTPNFENIAKAPSSAHGFCFLIGMSIFFMLLVEVSTNSICVTKAERNLKKITFYSFNFLLVLVIYPIISIFLGWPFFSGAMIRSNAHCLAMAKWSVNDAPGVPRRIIGVCEQRISGMLVGILVFLSVFLGSILRLIPMASMYGMFLYMGVMGVRDMIVWKRLVDLMKLKKYWHKRNYIEGIPHWNIVILVSIQIFFVIILSILYILSQFTINVWTMFLFPVIVGMYAMLRGYILPCWPRLNTHLSMMDKKHAVTVYDGTNPGPTSSAGTAIPQIKMEETVKHYADAEDEDMIY